MQFTTLKVQLLNFHSGPPNTETAELGIAPHYSGCAKGTPDFAGTVACRRSCYVSSMSIVNGHFPNTAFNSQVKTPCRKSSRGMATLSTSKKWNFQSSAERKEDRGVFDQEVRRSKCGWTKFNRQPKDVQQRSACALKSPPSCLLDHRVDDIVTLHLVLWR